MSDGATPNAFRTPWESRQTAFQAKAVSHTVQPKTGGLSGLTGRLPSTGSGCTLVLRLWALVPSRRGHHRGWR